LKEHSAVETAAGAAKPAYAGYELLVVREGGLCITSDDFNRAVIVR
jgi:hypothetical protein